MSKSPNCAPGLPPIFHGPSRPAPPSHGGGRKREDDRCERRLKKQHYKKHRDCR